MTEMDIQNSILEFLSYKGIFAWRQGNHSVFDEKRKIYRRKSRFELAGISDILGVLRDGRILAIEVKRDAKASVSQEQKSFIESINDHGGIGLIAWSIEQVEEAIYAS